MTMRLLRGGEWASELQNHLPLQALDQWMRQRCLVVKSDRHSLVALGELQQKYCYLKLYQPKYPVQQLVFRLGRGRAVQAYDHALRLAASNIPVPQPLACMQVDGGVLLVTEGMERARDLKSCWQDKGSMVPQLSAAAESLASLHRGGFAHGDSKWSNLLWSDNRVYLVDLEAVQACRPGSAAQWRDLARFTVNAEDLALPSADYEAFLASYCQHRDIGRAAVLAAIQQPVKRLRRRHRRKYGERGKRLV